MSQRELKPPKPLRADHTTARIIREDIWRPAVQQNNWSVFVVVGREGDGKSLTCASILKAADPDFSVDHTHFDAVPFLEDVADEEQTPGTAVMGDEVGVAFGKRTWHDREQIEANQALQTARDGNKIIGLTLPRLEELDSQLISRAHVLVEVEGTTSDDDHAIVKWKRINPSRDGRNETRTKFPRMNIDGPTRRVKRIRIGPPPEDYVEPYQEKKHAWKQGLYDDTIENFKDDDPEDTGPETPQEIVEDIIDRDAIEEYIGEVNGGQRYVDKDRIAFDYEVGEGTASKVKQGLKKEGDIGDVL
jgi:hypothetical protein